MKVYFLVFSPCQHPCSISHRWRIIRTSFHLVQEARNAKCYLSNFWKLTVSQLLKSCNSYLISLNLTFLFCRVGTIIVSTFKVVVKITWDAVTWNITHNSWHRLRMQMFGTWGFKIKNSILKKMLYFNK